MVGTKQKVCQQRVVTKQNTTHSEIRILWVCTEKKQMIAIKKSDEGFFVGH